MASGGAGQDIVWLITLFFIGAIGVLFIMNPNGFKIVGGTFFGGINTLGTTLTGSGYKKAH